MNRSDKQVIISLIVILVIYLCTWIAGLLKNRLVNYASVLNALCGLAIIIIWIQGQVRISQHTIETREIMVLGGEALIVAFSGYVLYSGMISKSLKYFQYGIFWIHFTVFVLFLIYMLTFRITKLI
jgi:uncharacterized SAM-binding protein YcdF (DUF218 family)